MISIIKNIRFILELVGLGIIVALLIIGDIKKNAYDKKVVDLQNQVASTAKTVEDQKGLYEKLSLQEQNVESVLDLKNTQLAELADQIKKSKEDLQSATVLALKWKHDYEATVAATETTVPGSTGGQSRTKVSFNKNWGTIAVSGYTLTNPAEATVDVSQTKALEISVAVSQDNAKAWHAYATTNDDNIGVNIELSAVNPWIDQPKWYENLGVTTALAFASTSEGAGVLGGLGLTYKLGKWEMGPAVYLDITQHVDAYYGLSAIWHPFASTSP